jgi:hypothetical protein
MTGGGESQFSRVERWYRRATAARDEHDQEDFLFAFFKGSFALRDWLIDSSRFRQQDIEALFSANVELRINRDLANCLKHHSIQRPSQEEPPSIAKEYAPENPTFGKDSRLVVLSEGKVYDALSLASRCLEIWRQFLHA